MTAIRGILYYKVEVNMQIQPIKIPTTTPTSEFMEPRFGPQAQALKMSPEEITEQTGQGQQAASTPKKVPGAPQINILA
jgi:hypothetical protein